MLGDVPAVPILSAACARVPTKSRILRPMIGILACGKYSTDDGVDVRPAAWILPPTAALNGLRSVAAKCSPGDIRRVGARVGIFRNPHPPFCKPQHRRLLLRIGDRLGERKTIPRLLQAQLRRLVRVHGRFFSQGSVRIILLGSTGPARQPAATLRPCAAALCGHVRFAGLERVEGICPKT